MRYTTRVSVVALLALIVTASTALAQRETSIGGFGGVSVNALESPSLPPSLGGTMTFNLTPGIQIVGEAGRADNVLPPLANGVFSLSQTDLRVSAFYGEAGVRFVVAPSSVVTPYVEATGGMARLNVSTRFGAVANAATTLALGLVGRTTPMAGAGGGILLRGGPVVFDLGYRYKQLFADDILRIGLGLGQELQTHQVRAGIGVRF